MGLVNFMENPSGIPLKKTPISQFAHESPFPLSEKLTARDQLRYGAHAMYNHTEAKIYCIEMLHKIRLTKKTIWDSLEVRFHPANVQRFVDKGGFSRPQLVQYFWSKVKLVVVYLSVGSSPRNLQFDELTIWIPWTMSKAWKKIIRKNSIVVTVINKIWVQSYRFFFLNVHAFCLKSFHCNVDHFILRSMAFRIVYLGYR